ncbi:MAG: endo-1,4-beta-xylanase, partial [Treponema sp.]|nr:endo-1,4-beta-xylanase [Treponema sp.]
MKKITFLFILILTIVSCKKTKPQAEPQIPIPKSLSNTIKETSKTQSNWKDVPALKDAYKDYFDYFGFAVPEAQLKDKTVMDGISWQASCFTCENECKPDFIFNWAKPTSTEDFEGEDGKIYQVPSSLAGFGRLSQILQIAKDNKMLMRGHVLVWHSQTPDWFFKQDYNASKPYVEKAEMTARQEWYIKSVLEFVKNWEEINNDGKHIIITWDVVNEACTDGAWTEDPLRTASPWYSIYKDDSFIVNAFRFANRYAPADVKLSYNDYSCYSLSKTKAICKVVQDIQSAHDARIDVIGMQSHVSMTYPTLADYEKAVQT